MPPSNGNFMIAAYAILGVLYLGYTIYLLRKKI